MAIREGRWDCTQCGTTKIPGSSRKCPNCGMSRPTDVKFYLLEDAPEVTDAAQIAQAEAGGDWYCEHCGSGSPNTLTNCRQCGAPRGSSPVHAQTTYGLGQVPTYGNVVPDAVIASQFAAAPAPQKSKARMLLLAVGLPLLLVCMCLAATFAFLLRTSDEKLEVTGFSWNRSVVIEESKTVREEGWAIPAGGREISHQQAINHYDKVVDHYDTKTRRVSEQVKDGEEQYVCGKKDLGNGHFKDEYCTRDKYRTEYHTETYQDPVYKQVPVYGTKYTYDIENWAPVRTERASGDNQNASWPKLELKANEREGEKKESYAIRLTSTKGKEYTYDLPFARWSAFKAKQNITAKIDNFGAIVEIVEAK